MTPRSQRFDTKRGSSIAISASIASSAQIASATTIGVKSRVGFSFYHQIVNTSGRECRLRFPSFFSSRICVRSGGLAKSLRPASNGTVISNVWPFIRRAEYKAALDEPKYFAGAV